MTLGKAGSGDVESAPIVFRLDPASGVPTYLQLVHQVEHALLLGHLKPGDRLPKIRDVVADLAINPNTVLKAYRELEHKGLVSGRPGQGTFVQASAGQATLPELTGLRREMRAWIARAADAGLDQDSVVALFTTTLREFAERREVEGSGGAQDRAGRAAGGIA